MFAFTYALSCIFQLYGFVSFYTQLWLKLFICWSSPLLFDILLTASHHPVDEKTNSFFPVAEQTKSTELGLCNTLPFIWLAKFQWALQFKFTGKRLMGSSIANWLPGIRVVPWLRVSVCECVYVCIYVCMYVCMYVCVCVCVCVYIYIYIYIYIHTHTYIHIYILEYTHCIHAFTNLYVYVSVCVCVCVCVCAFVVFLPSPSCSQVRSSRVSVSVLSGRSWIGSTCSTQHNDSCVTHYFRHLLQTWNQIWSCYLYVDKVSTLVSICAYSCLLMHREQSKSIDSDADWFEPAPVRFS